jgi:hypothetical protein
MVLGIPTYTPTATSLSDSCTDLYDERAVSNGDLSEVSYFRIAG